MPSGVYKHKKGYKSKYIVTESARNNMRISHLGKYSRTEAGKISFREKMSGKNNPMNRPGVREKQKTNIRKGEHHYKWNPDREEIKKRDDNSGRRSSSYNTWVLAVYGRDNYKCRIGNEDCKGRIEAHHILSYTTFPELRYDINNGITLCHYHHPFKRVEEQKMIPIFKKLVLQH
jgi:hypothetical protein